MISLICRIRKKKKKKEKTKTHRYREKIGGCQRERGLGEQKVEGDQEPRAQTLSSKINKS